MNVEDINAVITGGSSGLGKATAEIILSNGGKVTILDTQKDIGEFNTKEKFVDDFISVWNERVFKYMAG